eukprot:2614677-Amphidinium_carterae.1
MSLYDKLQSIVVLACNLQQDRRACTKDEHLVIARTWAATREAKFRPVSSGCYAWRRPSSLNYSANKN